MKLLRKIKKEFIFGFNYLRYNFIRKRFKDNSFKILDVGAGNHSAKKFKYLFPFSEYSGIDLDKTYNNDQEDFNQMENFYEMDITNLKFESVPNNYFDVIVMSHIIEHLHNGDSVIVGIIEKLKHEGFIYIEYPSERSTKLPSMKGTLNFYDDPTHVRIYTLTEISNIFLKNNIKIIKKGTRRNSLRIIFLPFIILYHLISKNTLVGSDYWDLFGFAEYIIGEKN